MVLENQHFSFTCISGKDNFDCIEVSIHTDRQCVDSRPAKLKPISRVISSEWYVIFGERIIAHWDKSPQGQKPTGQNPTGQKYTA